MTKNDARWKPDSGKRDRLDGQERTLCFNAADGRLLWKREFDCPVFHLLRHGSPLHADGGRKQSLRPWRDGRFSLLGCADGHVIWAKDLKKEYHIDPLPTWGFSGHPLVDGNKLLVTVGGDGSVLVAFDKDSGKELWRALSAKESGYCPPSIIEAGGVRQLVIWTPDGISSVNPENGKLYWTYPLEPEFSMSIQAPRKWKDYLFEGGIGFKAAMLKLAADRPAVTQVWLGTKTTGVYPVNCPPFIEDGTIYAVDQPGVLRAVKVETGERLWEAYKPVVGHELPAGTRINSGTAFLIKNGDRFFIFAETGDLIIAKLSPKGYEKCVARKLSSRR